MSSCTSAPSKIWTSEQKQQFDEYLRRHSSRRTPEQIANRWGVHANTVIKWQIRLSVRPTRKQVLAMAYSRKKQRAGRKRQQKQMFLNALTWKQRAYQRLLELATELRQRHYPPVEQVCRTCRLSWPRRRKFYRFNEFKISIGRRRWYRRDCVLCEHDGRVARRKQVPGQNNLDLVQTP